MLSDDDLKLMIEADSTLSCAELAETFGVTAETIRLHLRAMGKTWKLNKWVPYDLSDEQKQLRASICSILLIRHNTAQFFKQLVTCDEKWIVFDNSVRSHSWLDVGHSSHSVPKPSIHQKKVHLCVWLRNYSL